jgi:hypothetical protein
VIPETKTHPIFIMLVKVSTEAPSREERVESFFVVKENETTFLSKNYLTVAKSFDLSSSFGGLGAFYYFESFIFGTIKFFL